MSIEELFSSVVCCSCGLCCSNNTLCDECYKNTLLANGLSEKLLSEIKGLKYKSYSHGNRFEYSELYEKIKNLHNNNVPI